MSHNAEVIENIIIGKQCVGMARCHGLSKIVHELQKPVHRTRIKISPKPEITKQEGH